MNELADSFHSDNLKLALEQLNNTGDVLPRLSALKDGKSYEFSVMGMKFETALDIIKKQMKPDAVSFTAMTSVQLQSPGDETIEAIPRWRLFAMTFDCLGDRCVSLLDIQKEGNEITMRDAALAADGVSSVSIHAADNGVLEVRVGPVINTSEQ